MPSGRPILKRSRNRKFALEAMTVLLILINGAVFLFLPSSPELILYPGNILKGNLWCLITSGFLHSGISHLFWNMAGVFVFGQIVERHLGPGKTLFLYLGSMVLSMLLTVAIHAVVFHQSVAIIGASGAVMGLIAAAMLLHPSLPVMILGWLFLYADLQGLLSLRPDGISHLAHLIGFLSIGILLYALSEHDRRQMRKGLAVNILSFLAFNILNHII